MNVKTVLPEPNIDGDVTFLSIRHPALGTVLRLFNKEVTMNSCYDWVGSLREQPMYFNLIDSSGCFVSASSKVVEYGHLVLNVQITEKPPNFEEDGEVTVPGFSAQGTNNHLNNNSENLEIKRRISKNDLYLETGGNVFLYAVHRHDIIKSLFAVYSDASITKYMISLVFKGENASGDGVTRDVYTQIFKEIFKMYSSGIHANVPTGLSAEECEKFGRILCHSFIQFNIFPVQIAKAFFEQVVMDSVRHNVLLESFQEFVQKK